MPTPMSRRELIAWLAAGTGAAAATGALVFDDDDPRPSPQRSNSGPPDTTAPPPTDAVTPTDERTMSPRPGDPLLVVVEMPGGNDGLSMVVPFGSGAYDDARDGTAIAASDALAVDGQVGLHPNLAGLHAHGVGIVEGIGSTEPDGSHFEMLNRWWAGQSRPPVDGTTGWIGRLADVMATPDSPTPAVTISPGAHPITRSRTPSTMAIPGLDALEVVAGASPDDRFMSAYQQTLGAFAGSPSGGAMTVVESADAVERHREVLGSTLGFAERLLSDDRSTDPEAAGYSWSGLHIGLWLAATLFDADAGIRVVHVPMDGDFDTHEGHTWRHPELMTDLDTGLTAFRSDLASRGLADRVLVMTTSEFGRTLKENGSNGLDHGTSSTALLLGGGMSGRVGEAPDFSTLDENGELVATLPFESYLGGVVEGWLGVPAGDVFDLPTAALDLGL